MALFKISKGSKNNLPTTLTEGYCWYTYEDSKFYIDHKDENGDLVRKALNSENAETLAGVSLEELRNEIADQDIIILAEAQAYTDATLTEVIASGDFKGDKGDDGTSVTHIWNGTTLTVVSASGTSSANLKGDKGDSGYTPVRGTDYWTDADKAEIKSYVDDAILNGAW